MPARRTPGGSGWAKQSGRGTGEDGFARHRPLLVRPSSSMDRSQDRLENWKMPTWWLSGEGLERMKGKRTQEVERCPKGIFDDFGFPLP